MSFNLNAVNNAAVKNSLQLQVDIFVILERGKPILVCIIKYSF